jgi:hypothetical protein
MVVFVFPRESPGQGSGQVSDVLRICFWCVAFHALRASMVPGLRSVLIVRPIPSSSCARPLTSTIFDTKVRWLVTLFFNVIKDFYVIDRLRSGRNVEPEGE